MKILLLSLILNAFTGEPTGAITKEGEFDTIPECMAARPVMSHPTKPAKGKPSTVTVYTCAAPPGTELPPAPVEPIIIDEDDTRANT